MFGLNKATLSLFDLRLGESRENYTVSSVFKKTAMFRLAKHFLMGETLPSMPTPKTGSRRLHCLVGKPYALELFDFVFAKCCKILLLFFQVLLHHTMRLVIQRTTFKTTFRFSESVTDISRPSRELLSWETVDVSTLVPHTVIPPETVCFTI